MTWISVEDRIPDFGTRCLVAYRGVVQQQMFIFRDKFEWEEDSYAEDYGEFPSKDVTHWMPLPDPPGVEDAPDKEG